MKSCIFPSFHFVQFFTSFESICFRSKHKYWEFSNRWMWIWIYLIYYAIFESCSNARNRNDIIQEFLLKTLYLYFRYFFLIFSAKKKRPSTFSWYSSCRRVSSFNVFFLGCVLAILHSGLLARTFVFASVSRNDTCEEQQLTNFVCVTHFVPFYFGRKNI